MATPNQLGAAKQEAGSRDRTASSMDANARTFSFGDDHDNDDDRDNQHGAPRRPIDGKMGADRTHTSTTNETSATLVRYDVEHLATFSTTTSHEHQSAREGAVSSSRSSTAAAATDKRDDGPKRGGLKQRLTSGDDLASGGRQRSFVGEPREALQQLFELEKLSGIWTQRMQIGFDQEFMLIVDCETDAVVERFHRERVTKPEAFNHYSDIYSNIIVFNIDQQQQQRANDNDTIDSGQSCDRKPGELHIFQCISHKAKQLVADILTWKSAQIATDSKATKVVGLIDDAIVSDNTDTNEKLDNCKPTGYDKLAAESGSDAKLAEMSTSKLASPSKDKQAQELRGGKEAVGKLSSEEVTKSTDNNNSNKPAVTVSSGGSKASESPAVVPNVSVKETVQVFNQIAALREKSAGLNQTARPLSDASGSSSQSNSSSQQQQRQSGASSSGGFSRAHLNSAGQSYKQRSIRATLAPKTLAGDTQNGPASSSSTSSGGSSVANHKAASSSSSASQPENKSTEAQATKSSSRDGRPLAQHQHKLASVNNSSNHTQASPLEQHNQDHGNVQHNHRQASLVNGGGGGGKGSTGTTSANNPKKSSSNRSRLPATDGHNSSNSNHHHHNHHHNHNHNQHQDVLAGANSSSSNSNSSGRSQGSSKAQQQVTQPDEQVTSNESYVSVLNHCFDDIEKFILRIQHAYAAIRELQAKRRHTKRPVAAPPQPGSHPNGPLPPLPPSMSASELARLVAQAQGPGPDDYFEILSKFKLAFNLLAKLKGCIHEPNAPELIHFLFTPLAIIIESARNLTPPIDPTVVGIPYLNKDALDLLSNCCTSRESDLWYSLGPNWTETIDASLLSASRLPNSFQPIFSDGWAPVISELELIGLVAPRPPVSPEDGHHNYQRAGANLSRPDTSRDHNLTTAFNGNGHPAPISGKSSKQKGMPLSRNPIESSGYMHAEYLRDGLIDGVAPSLDEQSRAYPGNDETSPISHKQRLARHSIPNGTRANRPTAKHSTQAAAHRRNSDFIGHHYASQPPTSIPLTNSFIGTRNDHDLNGRYAAGYSTAPSNDYTELHIDDGNHHRDGHQYRAAGYLVRHGAQHVPNDHHSRRKGSKGSAYNSSQYQQRIIGEHNDSHRLDLIGHDMEREAMLADVGPAQTEWFYELKLRGALIVRVLFTRDANNDKELTVKRGEILEILDDTRKWWKARNIDLQVAHVPHTIVAVMEHYQTLDELLTGSAGDMIMMANEDQMANVDPQRYMAYRDQTQLADGDLQGQYYGFREERRNSKNAKGAFRYF